MKRLLVALLALVFLIGGISPLQAVENGDDATGNAFVVPISTDEGDGKYIGCTGTLIAPSIVVTAGHCVLDANGLLTKNVYVGLAGSARSSISLSDKISAVQITSTFQNTAGGKVQDDDLAFLTLGKSQTLRIPIILASEKQIIEFKSKAISLKSIGYGNYSNSGAEVITNPKSFDGTYSSINSTYTNSAYMASTIGRSCTGDSGGPILSITATQVTLVGILTGTQRGDSDKCGQKQSDGMYYTLFTVVGRYANLAFSAATDVMNSQEQTLSTQLSQIANKDSQVNQYALLRDSLKEQLAATQISLDTASGDLEKIQAQLDSANLVIETLKKKLPQSIFCIKGKLTKKVTAVMPACPKGYVLKG